MNYKRKHPRIASKGFCTLCKPHKRVGCHTLKPRDKKIEEKARYEKSSV